MEEQTETIGDQRTKMRNESKDYIGKDYDQVIPALKAKYTLLSFEKITNTSSLCKNICEKRVSVHTKNNIIKEFIYF
jgi:hypothetical protein